MVYLREFEERIRHRGLILWEQEGMILQVQRAQVECAGLEPSPCLGRERNKTRCNWTAHPQIDTFMYKYIYIYCIIWFLTSE